MGYRVVALSSGDSKKELAHSLGAHDFIDGSKVNQAEELQKMGGAKVILCTAPHVEVIETLVNGLAVDGQLVILAVGSDIKVPLGKFSLFLLFFLKYMKLISSSHYQNIVPMIMKRLSVKGWPSGTAQDSAETVAFANMANIKCQIERFPLEKVNEGYQHMMDNKVRFRAVLVMDHST